MEASYGGGKLTIQFEIKTNYSGYSPSDSYIGLSAGVDLSGKARLYTWNDGWIDRTGSISYTAQKTINSKTYDHIYYYDFGTLPDLWGKTVKLEVTTTEQQIMNYINSDNTLIIYFGEATSVIKITEGTTNEITTNSYYAELVEEDASVITFQSNANAVDWIGDTYGFATLFTSGLGDYLAGRNNVDDCIFPNGAKEITDLKIIMNATLCSVWDYSGRTFTFLPDYFYINDSISITDTRIMIDVASANPPFIAGINATGILVNNLSIENATQQWIAAYDDTTDEVLCVVWSNDTNANNTDWIGFPADLDDIWIGYSYLDFEYFETRGYFYTNDSSDFWEGCQNFWDSTQDDMTFTETKGTSYEIDKGLEYGITADANNEIDIKITQGNSNQSNVSLTLYWPGNLTTFYIYYSNLPTGSDNLLNNFTILEGGGNFTYTEEATADSESANMSTCIVSNITSGTMCRAYLPFGGGNTLYLVVQDGEIPAEGEAGLTVIAPENNSYIFGNTTPLTYSIAGSWDVDSCWYEMNYTNTTIAGCANTTLLIPTYQKYNFTLYVNDTLGHLNSTYVEFWGQISGLMNCTYLSDMKTLTFHMLDEENRTAMNATMEITLWLRSGEFSDDYSFKFEDNDTHHICIYPNSSSYDVDSTIEYYAGGYTRRNYFLSNATVNNVTTDINLYLLDDSLDSDVEFLAKDVYHNLQENVIIKVQRFYTDSNDYITVAMGRTGFDGITGIPLKQNTWYIHILERNYVVLKVYNPMYLTEIELELYIEQEERIELFEYWGSVAHACNYNDVTQNLVCTFSDTSGKMVDVSLIVEERRPVGNFVTIYENTTISTSGTLGCSLANHQNKTLHYRLLGRFCCSEQTYLTMESGIVDLHDPFTYGMIGVLITFFLLLASGLAGVWNPAVSIALTMVTLFVAITLNLISVGPMAFMAIVVVAAVIVYNMKV